MANKKSLLPILGIGIGTLILGYFIFSKTISKQSGLCDGGNPVGTMINKEVPDTNCPNGSNIITYDCLYK